MLTPWYDELIRRVRGYGGFCNAHLHLDRAETFEFDGKAEVFLTEKHKMIDDYGRDVDKMLSIATKTLRWLKDNGYRNAYTCADTTPEKWFDAFKMLDLARERTGFDLKIAAYSPNGLNSRIERSFFRAILPVADFVCSLPEKAESFDGHCEFVLGLVENYGLDVHFHIDQGNNEDGRDLERLCDVVGGFKGSVWVVHGISPACYDDDRFFALVDKMGKVGIGLICCPSAAIGMYQDRKRQSWTHNSIARVREMYMAGIPIMLGSDNICDVFSPTTTADLLTEIAIASNAVRFYDVEAWAKMASGIMGEQLQVRGRGGFDNNRP